MNSLSELSATSKRMTNGAIIPSESSWVKRSETRSLGPRFTEPRNTLPSDVLTVTFIGLKEPSLCRIGFFRSLPGLASHACIIHAAIDRSGQRRPLTQRREERKGFKVTCRGREWIVPFSASTRPLRPTAIADTPSLGDPGVLCDSLTPPPLSHRRLISFKARLQLPCNLLPEELRLQDLCMLAPAEDPVLHLVRPGDLNDDEGCGSPDRHNPSCGSQDSPP